MKYITVLLICQRFGDAIVHLWQTSKTLSAIHLTILCLHYGLILPYIPLTQNPQFNHIQQITYDNNMSTDLTPYSILTFFFNSQFQNLFPEISVDYFLYLNSNWLPSMQLLLSTTGSSNTTTNTSRNIMSSPSFVSNETSLVLMNNNNNNNNNTGTSALQTLLDSHILRSKGIVSSLFETFFINLKLESLTKVVGEVATMEKPITRGYLHEYMSIDMINTLLIRCAYHLLHTKKQSEIAIYFYKLAGRFTDALDELCHQLSLHLMSTNLQSIERKFWITQSIQYYEMYVSSGTGPLNDCLQKDDRNDLVQTFLHLLNISTFMDAYIEHHYIDSINILEEVSCLPMKVTSLKNCVLPIISKNISNYIQYILDDLILYAIDCLLKGYSIYYDEVQSVLLTAQQQNEIKLKMEIIKDKISCLVTFTSDIITCLNRNDTLRLITSATQPLLSQQQQLQQQQQSRGYIL